jgi:hypothetical protein
LSFIFMGTPSCPSLKNHNQNSSIYLVLLVYV